MDVHIVTEWLRLEGTCGGRLVQPPCTSKATQEPIAQDCAQTAFECLQRYRLHNLLGQPGEMLSHLHSEKGLPGVQREPPVSQCVPWSCHWAPLEILSLCSAQLSFRCTR